ncbi:MAG: hypothetical protein RR280_06710 [Bacteroidaceae bacterium]
MKRFFILFSVLYVTTLGTIIAQERNITLPEMPNKSGYSDYLDVDNGYWCSIEVSGGATVQFKRRNMSFGGIAVINGYRINEFIRAGIGFGTKYYINNKDVRHSSIPWTFPLYVDLRGNFISQDNRTLVPYWSFDIGAEIRDGFFCSPTLGLRIGEKRSSFLVGVSYSYNEMKTLRHKNKGRSLLLLKIGYEF